MVRRRRRGRDARCCVVRPKATGLPEDPVEGRADVVRARRGRRCPATTPLPCGHASTNSTSPCGGHGDPRALRPGCSAGCRCTRCAAPTPSAGTAATASAATSAAEDEPARAHTSLRNQRPRGRRRRGSATSAATVTPTVISRNCLRVDEPRAEVLVDLVELARRVRLRRTCPPLAFATACSVVGSTGTCCTSGNVLLAVPIGTFWWTTARRPCRARPSRPGSPALQRLLGGRGRASPCRCSAPPSETSRIVAGGCGWPGLLGPTAFFATRDRLRRSRRRSRSPRARSSSAGPRSARRGRRSAAP